jgi:hypothetical protein
MKFKTLVILTLILCSCSNEKNQSIISIDVLTPTGPELKNLSDIAEDIQYIPLETHPEALMKFVSGLKVTDDKFYIRNVSELLCFDKKGKLLYKLNKQGRGPDEYLYLSDYDINPEKKEVVVLSGDKLIFYNEVDTGFRYSKQINLEIRPQYCDFIPDQDNILLSFAASTGEKDYQCVIINQEGDTLAKRPNYYMFTRTSKVVMSFSIDNVINRDNDALNIKGFLSDTMFTITKDYKFIPIMILNTGGNGIRPDFLANVPIPDSNSGSPMEKFLMLSEIIETERYLLYRYYYQKNGFWGVYDKNSGENRQFDVKSLIKDDIAGGIDIEPRFACNGILYSWTDAMTFKKYMSADESKDIELKSPERAAELKRIAESIKEDDNNILIAITPRK